MHKMDNRTRLRASLIAAGLAGLTALPLSAYAAGIGNLTVLSPLGQQLQAELSISATPEELASLSVRLASLETFRQAGVEYVPTLSTLRFSLEKRANGQPYVRVTSNQSVNEPFLDILVELNWAQGRLVREYTFLLDPPEALQKAPAAAVAAPEVRTAPLAQPAPAPAPQQQAEIAAPLPSPSSAPTAEKKIPADRVSKPPPEAKPPAEKKPTADKKPPVEKAPAAAQAAPAKSGDRLVKSGDTLSKIAAEVRPEGASLDQMLLALFNGNKAAFDADNMHRLRAGKILAIPDAQTIAAIDKSEARKIISAQAADFNAYRQKLAAVAGAKTAKKEEAPRQAAIGKIAPKVEDKVPAPTGKDKLQVSRTEAAKDTKPGAAGSRSGIAEEDLVAKEKSLKEAKSRITELEKNVGEMKKLAELKSQSLADLQKQAQTAGKPAAAPVPAPATTPVPVAADKAAAVKPAEAPKVVEAPKLAPAAKPAEPAKPPEAAKEKPVEAVKRADSSVDKKPAPPAAKPVEPAAAKPPVAVPPPPEPPSFIDENPELVYGGGIAALLLALLGISAARRKRQSKEAAPQNQGVEDSLMTNSVFGTTGGGSVDTSNSSIQTDFSQSGMGSIDTDEGVDPVAEADVYMAYGRDAQAEEILVDALKTDPHRLAIHLKLLEIYAGRGSVQQFETLAGEVFARTAGNGAEWDKSAALGRDLDPANPLYAAKVKSLGDSLGPESVPTQPAPAPSLAELAPLPGQPDEQLPGQFDLLPGTSPQEQPAALDFDLDLGAHTEPGEEFELLQPSPVDVDLDLDLDLDAPIIAEEVPAADDDSTQVFRPDLQNDLDVETLSPLASFPGSVAFEVALPAEPATPLLAPAAENLSAETLDFDLDLPVVSDDLQVNEAASAKPLDFDFDLELPTQQPVAEPSALDRGDSTESIDSIESIALGLTASGAPPLALHPVVERGAAVAPLPAQAATDRAEDVSPIDETTRQEVATKLELAQAYEEMGDSEGARELLQEVLDEGDQAQKDAARNKLALLG